MKNNNQIYTSKIISKTEAETDTTGTVQEKDVISQTLHNSDIVSIESKDDLLEEKYILMHIIQML